MNKSELIEVIASKMGGTKVDAEKAMNAVLDSIFEGVVSTGTCKVGSYGTVKMSNRSERMGHNPQTGESLIIPACKTVKFSVSKNYKEFLNK